MNKLMECMKNDINFQDTPYEVIKYIMDHAKSECHQYVSWLCSCNFELVQRTWAYRLVRGNIKYIEVERKTPIEEMAVRRNIYFTQMGGYHPVYEPKTVINKSYYYGYSYPHFDASTDWNKWHVESEMGIATKVLNYDFIFSIDKYKYCGYSGADPVIKYLRNYEKNPKVEYFGKLGIRYSKKIEQKIKKDKQFLNWLRQQDIKEINMYGPIATILAYDRKISIEEARRQDSRERQIRNHYRWCIPEVKGTGIDVIKLNDYLEQNGCGSGAYNDYLKAVKYLGLDLKDTKNIFPNNFSRMHDLRISQYDSEKARENIESKRELQRKFRRISDEYSIYSIENDDLILVMPKTPYDLVMEGRALSHCVGRMGYDKKMAEGKCLIGFIRKKNEPKKPYVTCEYLFNAKMISQVYAEHDSKPPKEVSDFALEWGKVLNEALKEKKEAV